MDTEAGMFMIFVYHKILLFFLLFSQPFRNVKTVRIPWAIQSQVAEQI